MSYMQPSFRMQRRIQGKINHYENAMGVNTNVNLNTKFIKFFCLDATGRLGDREFVKLVCGNAARKRFYLKISVLCAKAFATAIIA